MLAALAAGGAGVGGLLYQLFRRPLPKTAGEVRVEGLEAPVTIARDRLGVPRIEARTIFDLCFGQGYCHAQDRLWQLDFYRRVAAGRVSEFAGPEGLLVDRLMRTLGFRRLAELEAAALPDHDRSLLEAYGRGVDAGVAAASALPFEHQLLRISPEPWSPADSLAVGKIIALGFSTNMESELFRSELVDRVGPELAVRLEPRYPRGNPLVVPPGETWSGDPLALADQIRLVREAIGLSPEPAGSNNWAVSGERSVTGAPLLAGDPHITTTIPDVWYSVELHSPEVMLRGASMVHFPGVLIGQSRHVAWSFTNVMADVQDLFIERIRRGHDGAGPQYEFEGSWRPVTAHREEIGVRGRAPERLEVEETHHGPIVREILGASGDQPLALAFTALRDPSFGTRLAIDVGQMESGPELVEEFRDYNAPCMNLVWADSRGDIGYKLVGKLPLRRGACPDLPKPGWTGEFEWDGYVPYEELPSMMNPPSGVIVTANNRIEPEDYPHHITSDYLDGFRAVRVAQLLGEAERHTIASFERIQSDLYSIPGERTAKRLGELTPRGDRQRMALELLRGWDHRLEPASVAASIYAAFTVHFARAVSEAAIGDPRDAERWRSRSLLGFTPMIASPWRWQARLLELWEEADPEVIGGDWDDLALGALEAGVDDLEERFGGDPSSWTWGRVHGVRFAHALGEGEGPIPALLDRLLSRRAPAGGGQETVSQIGFTGFDGNYTGAWAPSYRLIADVGDPGRSRWQHMTGQSGHPWSPHYDDLIDDWLAARTNPVDQPAVATLTLEPE